MCDITNASIFKISNKMDVEEGAQKEEVEIRRELGEEEEAGMEEEEELMAEHGGREEVEMEEVETR